jgi:hypothetical protein
MPESGVPAPGNADQASAADHRHQRITSAVAGVLGAGNEATVTFAFPFTSEPHCEFTYRELADNPPIEFKVKSWVTDANGAVTGCVVKAYRGQLLPATLTLLTALVNFNVFGGSAVGIPFTCFTIPLNATP